MNAPKHAPGPWAYERHPDGHYVVSDNGGVGIGLRAQWEDVAALVAAAPALVAALGVIVLDARIHAWLTEHDPKALAQAMGALAKAQEGACGASASEENKP